MSPYLDAAAVIGIGMVSSLGLDAVTSCAAQRAGITRVTTLDEFQVLNEDEGDYQGIFVHKVPVILDGFDGFARLVRLAVAGVKDLLSSHAQHLDFARTGFYIVIPSESRTKHDLPRQGADITTHETDQEKDATRLFGERLCRKIVDLSGCDIPARNWQVIDAGHAGVAVAVEKAMENLSVGKIDRCLVLGVDSFLSPSSLAWLHRNKRLKTSDNPVGFQPGEACACVLLENFQSTRSRGCEIHAVVSSVSTGFEPNHMFSGNPAGENSLAKLVTRVYSQATPNPSATWIISDLNGEVHRAHEWGNATVQISPVFPSLRSSVSSYPAASFGDTGAASGAVAMCTAIRAFARNYAPSNEALVVSSSDFGARAALLLRSFSHQS